MNYTSIKRKVTGGLLAVALLVTVFPVQPTHAATIAELQAQLQVLIAQVQALSSNMPANNPLTCTPFTSSLFNGKSGADVTRLQDYLIQNGQTIPAGATGYFGIQTQSAVAAFQSQHGIVPAAGYFGPITIAKVNELCAATPQIPSPGDTASGDENDADTGDKNELTGGEAILQRFDVRNGDKTNLEEGQKNISVMDIEFEVKDGDVRINRLDLGFTPDSNNNETDPWDTFGEVSIWYDGDRIGKIDASDEDNWDEDSPANGDYRLRMTGLSLTLEEDTDTKLTVKVSTERNIKGVNDGEVWDIFIPHNGIRAVDSIKSNLYVGDSADKVTIDIDEAGSDDELIVKRSDEDVDATTLQLKSNSRSGWTTVFAFDIDTDDSMHDIEIRKLPIELTVSSSTVDTFMRDARIKVDGKTYTKKTVTDGTTNTLLFEFSKNELVLDAGDRTTVEVQVEFKPLASKYEGTTISGSVDTAAIVAKGADDLKGNQISGTATGEVHTMRTSGVILKGHSTSADFKANSSDTKTDDEGMFAVKFDVTAFDRDIFIARSVERGATLTTAGINYIVEDASQGGVEIASGTVSAVITSDAKTESGFYKIAEGDTKSFTLMVEYDPEYQSFYNVQLHSLNWNTSASAPTTQQLAVPEANFETTIVSIGN